jgi:uncharacterized protein YacL (UPF0231 family)
MSHMEPSGRDDVEGHAYSWSDENLKQAISQIQDALQVLRQLEPSQAEDDVEGHAYSWSDENLKQAVSRLENALAALRALRTTPSR